MGVGRIFTSGFSRLLADFPEVAIKSFQGEAKSGEILFFLLKTTKTTLFAKNVIEKYRIKIQGQGRLSHPLTPVNKKSRKMFFILHMPRAFALPLPQIPCNLFSRQNPCE